jgi:hypothetical protein
VLVASNQTVNYSEYLSSITASAGRITQDEANRLRGVDDEHTTDGEGNTLGIDIGGILVV